jgi:uncharacterized protein YbjT (DUF2867 family)
MKKIIIIGATGKVGSKVADLLLAQQENVTLIARGIEKLEPFKQKGAEILPISVFETDKLTNALRGADAVLTMIASNPIAPDFLEDQRKQMDAQIEAIKLSGIKYVVNLSSVGCHVSDGNGVLMGLTEMEAKLNALDGVNVLHLRPTFFMENTLYAVGLIKHQGIYGLPIRGDVAFPMVATKDVAQAIAQKLTSLNFQGKSVETLLGPKDYTLSEITRDLGKAIQKEIPYIQFPVPDFVGGVVGSGGSQDYAEKFGELMVATDKGLLNYHARTPQNTTPTTFEEYAQSVFAPIYHMS